MKTLYTPRLILRRWELEDSADLYEYAQTDLVGPNAGWLPHRDEEESKRIIKMFRGELYVFAIVLKSENKVIGSIGLHDRTFDEPEWSFFKRHLDLGFALSHKYWGQGIVPEAVKEIQRYAFEDIEIDALFCGHFDFNIRSKKVIEKTGFTYSYTTIKTIDALDGAERTIVYYKMSAEDYYKRRGSNNEKAV